MSTKTTWAIDPTHSEVGFKVKHMMFTNVSGKFLNYDATVETTADDFSNAIINFHAETASVNTGSADRDTHLKSADFFDAEQFPTITFAGESFSKKSEGEFELKGNLTIKDVTKPVTLAVEFGGLAKDPWGNIKAGFTVTGKINRKDFGLTWNAALETGGVLVGEDVKIIADIQLVKK